jgi:hypothetical protein
MKTRAALKQMSGWFPFLVVLVPGLWGLSFWLQDWPLGVIAAAMSVYLVLDAWNLVKIMRAGQKETKGLDKQAPRT